MIGGLPIFSVPLLSHTQIRRCINTALVGVLDDGTNSSWRSEEYPREKEVRLSNGAAYGEVQPGYDTDGIDGGPGAMTRLK